VKILHQEKINVEKTILIVCFSLNLFPLNSQFIEVYVLQSVSSLQKTNDNMNTKHSNSTHTNRLAYVKSTKWSFVLCGTLWFGWFWFWLVLVAGSAFLDVSAFAVKWKVCGRALVISGLFWLCYFGGKRRRTDAFAETRDKKLCFSLKS
jgi:hypothetical protein